MSAKSLSNSVSSLVEENLFGGEMDGDDLLRRLSPYATLRPGDLAALMGIPSSPTTDGSPRKLARSAFDDAIEERSDDSDRESAAEEEESSDEAESLDVVVRGQDIGDLPAQYVVRGLRPHEMPVIGVYVDPRIVPGFSYSVRRLGSDSYLFQGRALTLQSVGLGYGKRLTFAGDSLNFNDNFFWSDSDPSGFAFSLHAVQPGDKLTVYASDGSGMIGEVEVERVPALQKEMSSQVVNGSIIKHVSVTLECNVTYCQRLQSMVDLRLHDVECLTGEAIVVKKKGSRVARLDAIHNVQLACAPPGFCTLQVEP